MPYPLIVSQKKCRSLGILIQYSFAIGLFALFVFGGLARPLLSHIPKPTFLFIHCTITLVLTPLFLAWCLKLLLTTTRRIILSALSCTLGTLFVPVVSHVIPITYDRSWCKLGISLLIVFTVYSVLTFALLRFFKNTRGPLIMQDGFRCPNCTYCLIGNQSMQCPECGKPFTFEQLGITKNEFSQRAEQ